MDNHLILFLKAPRLGRVKRRLAAGIGPVAALCFYRRTITALIRRVARDRRWKTWTAVTPDQTDAISQGQGSLGERMARVMRHPPPGPVVLVGGDIPGIRPSHIAEAFRLLGNHDAVFGPAADGGFWLVGLRRRPRFIDPFAHVRWSTASALADTMANLEGLKVAFVETLADVDDANSYFAQR